MVNFAKTEQPIARNIDHINEYAEKYSVPPEDVGMIALNASGIASGDIVVDRCRCRVTHPESGRTYFTALTVTSNPFSPFEHHGDHITLDDEFFAETSPLVKDTCTDTYWRDGTRVLTLNTNSRANCHGCTFCGTYSLENDESAPLLTLDALRGKAAELSTHTETGDMSEVERIGVVTGCFGKETKLAEHLALIREAFGEYGFNREIQYVGSQLRDEKLLRELVAQGDFSLYVTLEAFTRRSELMKRLKSSLTLDGATDLMQMAKDAGADTTYLYISGLDGIDDIEREAPRFTDVLTRFPNTQIFQAYTPQQVTVRKPEAAQLDYFLKARQIFERTYPDLTPELSMNFRSLWYTGYNGKPIADTGTTFETEA